MNKYKSNGKFSQFGEQGIIDEVLRRIGITKGVSVEFGAPTREFCSNTLHLEPLGWTCHFYDINPSDPKVTRKEITENNINELPLCNLLSLDTDGNDYSLWRAYDHRPEMVIVEINSSLDPDVDYFTPERGANYSYMKKLGERKGYTLLCHTGNMLWIRNDHASLFPDKDQKFDTSWIKN